MQKRLCGREQEFGMRILPTKIFPKQQLAADFSHGGDLLDYPRETFERWRLNFAIAILEEVAGLFPVNIQQGNQRIWLENGSLIYIDMQYFVEAATAECLAGSFDVVLQEKALEQMLNEAVKAVTAKRGVESVSLYKNNTGPLMEKSPRPYAESAHEATYAGHQNYSYLTNKAKNIFHLLRSFIPTALPLTGNGHIYKSESGDSVYILSQRAGHIKTIESTNSTSNRPLINTRNEHLMDKSTGFGRLHLISRDATRCEFQTWLVDAMTHLVLRLGEEGANLPARFSLADPLQELRNINFSLKSNLDYEVGCGFYNTVINKMNLIAYNRFFLELAKQLNPLSENEKKCLEEWERVLELLEVKAFEKLVGELDWVTKWHLLKNKMKKYGFGLNDIRAWKINMGYHDISASPKQSWFALLEEEGYIKHLVTKSDIKKAITTPPETRARSRGEFIRKCNEIPSLAKMVDGVCWSTAMIGHHNELIYFGEKNNPSSPSSSTMDSYFKKLGL